MTYCFVIARSMAVQNAGTALRGRAAATKPYQGTIMRPIQFRVTGHMARLGQAV